MPMDVADVVARRKLTNACLRASSAYDAHLREVDAGPVRKVFVSLWSDKEVASETSHPPTLTGADDVIEVQRAVSVKSLLEMQPNMRALTLVRSHHSALMFLADGYGWDPSPFERALEEAERGGVIARYSMPPAYSKDRRLVAEAFGSVDEDGMHLALRVRDAQSSEIVGHDERIMRGDWHLLRGAMCKVSWRGDAVTLKPIRKAASAIRALPIVTVGAT